MIVAWASRVGLPDAAGEHFRVTDCLIPGFDPEVLFCCDSIEKAGRLS
jgi:hypothetical protein